MSLADLAAAALLGSLVVYGILGGADFGGGVWDLFASGPRAKAQRALIEEAIAPIWEANHVWLILAVVLLFSCFPPAFAALGTALHVPLSLALLGVVLRGCAFSFRKYGAQGGALEQRWGRVFAVASLLTPLFLGVVIAAVTSGELELRDGAPIKGFFRPWLGLFPLAVGLFAVALFAFLAAVFLTNETGDPSLRDDFRARALGAGIAAGACALFAALVARRSAPEFVADLLGSPWSWPLQAATALCAVGTLGALWKRRFRLARVLAPLQVALVLAGWGVSQRPYLIAPDITVDGAAAPEATLRLTLIALGAGSLLLLPSLWWLFRTFKSEQGSGR